MAEGPARGRWRVWLALLAAPLLLAVSFGGFAAVLAWREGLAGDALVTAVSARPLLPGALGFGLVLLVTWRCAAADGLTLEAVGLRRPGWLEALGVLAGGAALAAGNARWVYPLIAAAEPTFDPQVRALAVPVVVATVLLGAVAEDTLYRGYALEVLGRRHGRGVAALVTSACYALLTPAGGWPLKVWAFGLGLALSALMTWRRSLGLVVLVHALVGLWPRAWLELAGS